MPWAKLGLANAPSFNLISAGVTAARPEAIFDQPFPKPSHSTQLFLILPFLLLHLLLLRLAVLLPLPASSQPAPWNLSAEGHRASDLVAISTVAEASTGDHNPERPPGNLQTSKPCCSAADHFFLHYPGEIFLSAFEKRRSRGCHIISYLSDNQISLFSRPRAPQ